MWNEVPNRGWIFKKAFGPINFKGIIKGELRRTIHLWSNKTYT